MLFVFYNILGVNTLLALEDDPLSTVIRSFFGFSVEVVRRLELMRFCEENTDEKFSILVKTKSST